MVAGTRDEFGRHPADLDVDGVLVGGRDHPLGPVARGLAQGERAGPVPEQGLEGLVRRVLPQASQLLRLRVEHHHPAFAGELAREFPTRLPGADDDDAGEVMRRCRFASSRRSGGVQAWRGVRTRCALRPNAGRTGARRRSGISRPASREPVSGRLLLEGGRDGGHRLGVPGRRHHPADGLLGVRRCRRTGFFGTGNVHIGLAINDSGVVYLSPDREGLQPVAVFVTAQALKPMNQSGLGESRCA